MTSQQAAGLDGRLSDLAGLWASAYATYMAACEAAEADEVTRDAADLVEAIEDQIREVEAATMADVAIKLKVVESYLDDEADGDSHARGMALSLSRDLIRMARTYEASAHSA